MTTTSIATRFGSGQAVRRIEDEGLLKGQGRFTDDVVPEGQLRAVFLRSPYAHARLATVDSAAARAMPGVHLVLSGDELVAAGVKAIPSPGADTPFRRPGGAPPLAPARRALAHERVRHVGEAVAVVVADTWQQARDAAEAIAVDYDELPAVPDIASATAAGAHAICPEVPDNIAAEARHGDAAAAEAAFAKARHVVSMEALHQRLVALSIEPRTVLAWMAEDGRLTVRMSTQMPSGVRDALVATLPGLKRDQARVVVGDVGGGFGMKTGIYPEDVAVAHCARVLGRPVKWTSERSEEFQTTVHGRDLQSRLQLALDGDGRILALRVTSQANVGAYTTGAGLFIQLLIGPWVQTSVYHVPVIDFHFQAVLTNRAATGPYRGAGRPEAIYNMERLMDQAARAIGLDRTELRRRNFIRPEQMPYTNPMGQVYDVGRFEHVMDQGLAQADWAGFEARAQASRARGLWRGLGLATFLEWTGGNALEEKVTVSVLPAQAGDDGVIEVFTAVNGMGQGIATTLAQLVVDAFGVPLERIRIVMGDTDRGDGFGSAGSRSLFTGGSAVRKGAEQTLEEARKLAAQRLEAAVADIEYQPGRFVVRGTDLGVGLFELARAQPQARIHVAASNTVAGPSWPNGCHVCEVEVDPATGHVALVAYSSVNDVGRVVNPMIVRGQLDGGAVQGIGQALMERVVYDAESGQLLTGSLMDYTAPRADEVPLFVTRMDESTPCKNNPLGVKGVGELGTIGATPCVVNAVCDALARAGRADLAPRVQMPVTPARLWALIHGR